MEHPRVTFYAAGFATVIGAVGLKLLVDRSFDHPFWDWFPELSEPTAEYIVVEDFEDYNDFTPDRIFEHWKDGYGYIKTDANEVCGNGTGSIVGNLGTPYAEQNIVYGGNQSMPFFYNNKAIYYDICNNPINEYYSDQSPSID